MGTRSNIGILNADGSREVVYCHWDGYPSNNGIFLLKYYNSEDAARGLIALGDMSSLKPKIIAAGPHSYEKPYPDVTIFYHRDRGEAWEETQPRRYAPEESYSWEEWVYYWDVAKEYWIFRRGSGGTSVQFEQLTEEACLDKEK